MTDNKFSGSSYKILNYDKLSSYKNFQKVEKIVRNQKFIRIIFLKFIFYYYKD